MRIFPPETPARSAWNTLRDRARLHRGPLIAAPVFWAAFAVFLHPAWACAGFLLHAALCLPRRGRSALALFAAFPLLALWFAAREPFATLPGIPLHRAFTAADSGPVARTGTVESIPVPTARGHTFLFHESAGSRLLYRVNLESGAPPRWGAAILLTGTARAADPPPNPGQLDMRRVLRGQGAAAAIRAGGAEGAGGAGPWRETRPPPAWKNLLMRARAALGASLGRNVPRPALPLLEASLLNVTANIPEDTREAFFRSGMQHILAISGQHIGLLLAFLLFAGRSMRLPRKAAFLLAALVTAAYIPMVGAPVSVVRSGIMLACLLPATLLERTPGALHALCLTASADLLIDPHNILNLGFQLSYAATLALIVGSNPARALALRVAGLPAAWGLGEGPSARLRGAWALGILQMLLLSALVSLFTYPVLAASTHATTPWGVLGNSLTVPLGAAMLVGGLCTWSLDFPALLLPGIPASLAACAGAATGLCAILLEGGVFLLARLPGALRPIADPSAGWLALFCAGCALLVFLLRGGRILPAALCAALLLAAEAARPSVARLRVHGPGGGRITFLAVGHGDAAVLELPGAVFLIDAGDSPRIARNVILPFLQQRGIGRLDAVLITHPHRDHYGGAAELLEHLPVGRIIGPPEPEKSTVLWKCLHAKAREHGVAWKIGGTGQLLHSGKGVSLRMLGPDSSLNGDDKNNRSLVALLQTRRGRVLFTGDVEQPGQAALAASWPLWRGAWLKAPHHGSDRTTHPCFLRAAAPPRTVVSCGARWGFPGARTLKTLADIGSRTAVTRHDGAVTWVFGRDETVETRHLHPAGAPN